MRRDFFLAIHEPGPVQETGDEFDWESTRASGFERVAYRVSDPDLNTPVQIARQEPVMIKVLRDLGDSASWALYVTPESSRPWIHWLVGDKGVSAGDPCSLEPDPPGHWEHVTVPVPE